MYILQSSLLTKIGITNRTPAVRAKFISASSDEKFSVCDCFYFDSGKDAFDLEKELKKLLKKTYAQPVNKFDGYKECFYDLDPSYLKHLIEQRIRETSPTNEQHSSTQLLETA